MHVLRTNSQTSNKQKHGGPVRCHVRSQLRGEKCFMADNSILHCWPQSWFNPVCGWMNASLKFVTRCTFCRLAKNTTQQKQRSCFVHTARQSLLFPVLSGLSWGNFSYFFFPLCKYFHFSSTLKRECVKKDGNYSKTIVIVCSPYIFFFFSSPLTGIQVQNLPNYDSFVKLAASVWRHDGKIYYLNLIGAYRFTMCSPAYVGYNVLWSVILYVLRLVWWVRKMMTGNQGG